MARNAVSTRNVSPLPGDTETSPENCNRGGDGKDPAVPESICLPLDAEGPSFTALLVFVRCEHGMPRPR